MSDRLEKVERPAQPQEERVDTADPMQSASPFPGSSPKIELPTAAALRELNRLADPNRTIEVRQKALDLFKGHLSSNPDLLDKDFDDFKVELKRALIPHGEVEEYRLIARQLASLLSTSQKGRALISKIIADPDELMAQSLLMSVPPQDSLSPLKDNQNQIKKIEVISAALHALASPKLEIRELDRFANQLEGGDKELCLALCGVLLAVPSAMKENFVDQKEELRQSILNCLLGSETLSKGELGLATGFLASTLNDDDIEQICFDCERGSLVATELLLGLYPRAGLFQSELDHSLRVVMNSARTTAEQLAIISSDNEFLAAASPKFKNWLVTDINKAAESLSYSVNPVRLAVRIYERVRGQDFSGQREERVANALKTFYVIANAKSEIPPVSEDSLRRLAGATSPAVSGWAALLLGSDSREFHEFLARAQRGGMYKHYPDDLRAVVRTLNDQLANERLKRL